MQTLLKLITPDKSRIPPRSTSVPSKIFRIPLIRSHFTALKYNICLDIGLQLINQETGWLEASAQTLLKLRYLINPLGTSFFPMHRHHISHAGAMFSPSRHSTPDLLSKFPVSWKHLLHFSSSQFKEGQGGVVVTPP